MILEWIYATFPDQLATINLPISVNILRVCVANQARKINSTANVWTIIETAFSNTQIQLSRNHNPNYNSGVTAICIGY